jgi:hypothetical protein
MADALLEAKSPSQPIVRRGSLAVVTDLFTRFRDTQCHYSLRIIDINELQHAAVYVYVQEVVKERRQFSRLVSQWAALTSRTCSCR